MNLTNELAGYAELLEGHAAFLNVLARLYYKPLSDEELANIARLNPSDFPLGNAEIEEGLEEMLAYLRRGGSTLRQDINVDYTAAFYGISAWEGQVATPYESVFRSEEGILMQRETINAYRAYKAEAIRKDPDLGVPDDHLSFEMQFLAMMCERAAACLRAGDVSEAARNIGVQASFLDEHILSWFESMASVANKILEKPFYRGVLKATRGFLALERADLAEMAQALEAV